MLLATNLTPQASNNEDELQSNPNNNLYQTFIFNPKDKFYNAAFENIFSAVKKPTLKMQENRLFYQFGEPFDVYKS